MISISKVQLSDVQVLAPLFDAYRVFYEQPSDLDLAKQFLTDRINHQESIIYLAKWNDRPCGFTQLYRTFSSVSAQHSWILNDLFVDPSFRGKGIGEQLLKKAQEFTIADAGKGLALETAVENPARRLYERLGWSQETEYVHYFWKAP